MKSEEAWSKLEKDNISRNDGIKQFLLTPESPVDIYIGLKYPEKNRVLSFQTDSNKIYKPKNFPNLKYFAIIVDKNLNNYPETGAIRIILLNEEFKGIFSVLAEDIVNAVKCARNKKEGIEAFYTRLTKWICFLESFGARGLSPESARGLFGELWFLYAYLIKQNYQGIVESWTGPKGTPQDFQFAKIAVEVKTTIMKKPQKIIISNELQLDDKDLENLFLFHLSVNERVDCGITLPLIIQQIREILETNNQNISFFNQMLFDRGYLDEHSENYGSTGYNIRQEIFFLVADGFPRLTGTDLPDGVGDLTYTVNLSNCSKFSVDAEFVMKKITDSGIKK
jgi:hypothetical protein